MKRMKMLTIMVLVVGILFCQTKLSNAKDQKKPKRDYIVNQLVHNFNVDPNENIYAGDVVVITSGVVKASGDDGIGIPVGIADTDAVGGEIVQIIIFGISNHHSNLEVGSEYFAGADGSLTTDLPAYPYYKIGVAISETELLVRIDQRMTQVVGPPPSPPPPGEW